MGKTNSNSEHSDDGLDDTATEPETVSTEDVVPSPSNSESILLSTNNTAIPVPTPTDTVSVVKQVATVSSVSDAKKTPQKVAPTTAETDNTIRSAEITSRPIQPPQPSERTVVISTIGAPVNRQSNSVVSNETSATEPPAKKQRVDADAPHSQSSFATASTSENRGTTVGASNHDVSVVSRADTTKVAPTNPLHVPAGIAKSTVAPTSASTTQLLLPDYAAVRQTVKDLIGLLQLYGPLTANQLEYNLPPVVPASIPWSVHDVLSILVAIGLIQQVKGTNQYCMFGGIPRADVILPMDITSEIQQALHEADGSWKRTQMLREALRQVNTNHTSNGKHKHFKDILQQIVEEYPQVTNDPVYWTALRNCHIDMQTPGSTVAEKRSASATSKLSSNAAGASTASKKVASSKSPKTVTANEAPRPPPVTMLPPVAPMTKATPISTVTMPSTPAAPASITAKTVSEDQRKSAESATLVATSTAPPVVPAATNSISPASQAPS
jgi:hypothetical protein